MQSEITLVDRGRGLQLSTSLITVHDLGPYVRNECSYDEIARWLPSLSREEIAINGQGEASNEPDRYTIC